MTTAPASTRPAIERLHAVEHGIGVVWNALHGTYGEDGAVQGLCTCLGIPCTGSGILASALAMDKVMSKRIFEHNGVPTPRWQLLPGRGEGPADGADADEALRAWSLPLVVKPSSEGSSVGVSVVEDRADLAAAVLLSAFWDDKFSDSDEFSAFCEAFA